MHPEKQCPAMLAIILVLIAPLSVEARQGGGADVIPLASSSPLARLLPDTLAGLKATTDLKQITTDSLRDLVGDKAVVYREYLVTSAASREYAGTLVEVFETQHQFAAFGLFTFSTGVGKTKPMTEGLGSGGARFDGELAYWKGNYFVRVVGTTQKSARGSSAAGEALARAVADGIVPGNPAITHPPLLDSLPAASVVPQSQRYFLGPESLNAYVEHAREMFEFVGDTEASIAEYKQEGPDGRTASAPASDQDSVAVVGAAGGGEAVRANLPLKLVIIEYHTPQFATDAMSRVASYLSSLPEDEQKHIIVKRTGNYIVEAVNVRDREFAEGLINSVQYPYTVKWLRNPLWPTNDPFRTQKAAEMLLSTFGLLGLILLTVLVVGTVFGTTIFLKRRKQQQEMFSDAGGMLRLDIDQIESVILGLPPKRSEE